MSDFLGYHVVWLPCPDCGHEASKAIDWLKTHESYVCEGCGASVHPDAHELAMRIRWVEDATREFCF